ncbi:Vps54-domain-containing protein [Phellopilus nigrolimitatus]|nr:Vps54-domain-containing protein [Phellopilus nigrolimitatus]
MSDQQSIASTSRPGSPVAPLPDFSSARPYRFAWDAAARKAGPASVSGASEGRGDYFAYRPTLGNFNFSSASLALGAIPPDWSSSRYGFNAISTLVNSPHKKSAPPKAHAPVPPVIPSQLPRVRRKDFDAYLKAVAPEWEQFERTVQVSQEGQADAFASGLAQMEADLPITPRTPRFTHGPSIPPLESVPSVYFEPSFDLSDPQTFASVTEQRVGGEETQDPAALSHSLPLLEKLSHYADTIELHLISEVSRRSSSFFAALTNLNELQTESAQCLERIRKLRGMLRDVDEKGAKKGLEVVRLERKLSNMCDVREGVKTMQGVGEMIGVARSLASGGEWSAALGVVEGIQGMWEQESTQQQQVEAGPTKPKPKGRSSKRNSMLSSVPESISEEGMSERITSSKAQRSTISLSSLNAFASLPDHLRTLTLEITASLTSELVSVLQTDLLTQMDLSSKSVSSPELGSTEVDAARSERLTLIQDRLQPLAQGLKRTNGLSDSIVKWKEVALAETRASVKRHLPSSGELDEDESSSTVKNGAEKGAVLRNQLRDMAQDDFTILLRTIYATFLGGVQELQTQNAILLEVLQSLQAPDDSLEISSVQTDLSDILSSATELAHSRASKILSIRAEQHASLDLPIFLSVFNETWDFVIRTETICRRMVVGLRGAIVSQAKAFLQVLHQNRISQSAKFVEDEQWAAAEVSHTAQMLANVIVESAMRDPQELIVTQSSEVSLPAQANGISTAQPSSSKHLTIEDRKYFAVSATLKMLGLLVDYLKIISNLSLLTTDAVSRVIEFLKAFNSRTCQVVLGAGAMRSAGLKNITAKHLALASQSLSIVIALVPYVRECFRRHLNPKQAVMLVEFDKLKRDYQEHQQEIHSKLIAIMGDRLSAHCKTLQALDWSKPHDGANDYMTVLVKETVTLHKVLSRYLQEGVLEYIMSQVFAAINHRLSEEYGKIELPSQEAKDRLIRDTRYLHQHFSGLKNVNAPTGMLETVVGEKQVPLSPGTQLARTGSRSPGPSIASTEGGTPAHQPATTNAPSTVESANERLKGIFRRSSTFKSSDTKIAPPFPSPRIPSSPVPEKQPTTFVPEETAVLEPASSSPPPPTPEKQNSSVNVEVRMTPPVSPAPQRERSPRPMEKALPIPVPTLDSEGNVIDAPELTRAATSLPSPPPKTMNGFFDANDAQDRSSEASEVNTS